MTNPPAYALSVHVESRYRESEQKREKPPVSVSKDEVQVAAFNRFRQFRDNLLNIPDRLAAVLAAETDAKRVYEILASEIRKANEFADSNA